MTYLVGHPAEILRLALEHLWLTLAAVAIASAIGVPVGIVISRVRPLEVPTLTLAGLLYLIPSLALFAFLIPFLGLGKVSATVALVLYSLLVIIRNTAVGLKSVSAPLREAALGIGMSARQRLLQVELPLALPVIMGGIRIAAVMNIGIASIAAYIGAGGLGTLIFRGIATVDSDMVIAGAVPIAALALGLDGILRRAETWLRV